MKQFYTGLVLKGLIMKTADAFLMLVKTQMRPFDKTDYYGFAGVESPNPYIGEYHDEATNKDYILIVDGRRFNVVNVNDDGQEEIFTLVNFMDKEDE